MNSRLGAHGGVFLVWGGQDVVGGDHAPLLHEAGRHSHLVHCSLERPEQPGRVACGNAPFCLGMKRHAEGNDLQGVRGGESRARRRKRCGRKQVQPRLQRWKRRPEEQGKVQQVRLHLVKRPPPSADAGVGRRAGLIRGDPVDGVHHRKGGVRQHPKLEELVPARQAPHTQALCVGRNGGRDPRVDKPACARGARSACAANALVQECCGGGPPEGLGRHGQARRCNVLAGREDVVCAGQPLVRAEEEGWLHAKRHPEYYTERTKVSASRVEHEGAPAGSAGAPCRILDPLLAQRVGG
mmetsp:Transcript_9634/g.37504  ORF Transcript_9634/g.37504 Transcript_9634/m.37504 type:complete len:297 (+) Transcript_9634:1136-2026(+)